MQRISVLIAAAALSAAAFPLPADAHCRGCGLAAGIIGGVAAGAIIGSAIANPPPPPPVVYYEPAPPPPPPPAYVEPEAYDGPVCHVETEQVWDGYGYRPRRVRVCD